MIGKFLNDNFFSRLETLALNLQTHLSGYFGGKHLVKSYGQTVEFADFRNYQLGDDIRRIDWNLFARFKKYFLKLFTDERQMHIQIFLDCSASMGHNQKKAEYAIGVAAALGYLAVHNMDKVSINLIKEGTIENPFGMIVGKNRFFGAIGELEKIKFEGEVDFGEAIQKAQNVGRNDGLTIIISDLFTESDWHKAVSYLLHKNRQVLIVQVLSDEELNPGYSGRVDFIDCETKVAEDPRNIRVKLSKSLFDNYYEALRQYDEEIRQFCASRGVDFFSVNTEIPLEKTIFEDLLQARIMLA